MAFQNDHEDIQVLISVDPEKYTEEDHDNLCKFVMRAIVAFRGLVRHFEKIGEVTGLISFGIPDRITKMMGKKFMQQVREAFGFAMALVMGYGEYEKGFSSFTPEDIPDDLPRGYYIPFKKGKEDF
jgi:hypothetical protein